MSDVGKLERATQERVIKLFRDEFGYRFLGDWTEINNIEEDLLSDYLSQSRCRPEQISRTMCRLATEANNATRGLPGTNRAVYELLRYGVPVKDEAGKVTENHSSYPLEGTG